MHESTSMNHMKQEYKEDFPGKYVVTIKTSVEGLEELRSDWKKMTFHYFSDIDFYLTIVNSRKY